MPLPYILKWSDYEETEEIEEKGEENCKYLH